MKLVRVTGPRTCGGPARFAFNRSDSFHESARWTVLTPLAHRVDILLRAFEPRTQAPIGHIADPASEVPPLGLLLAARTEEDTLNAALHGNFASYHVQGGHHPIMLFRPNVRTAIRADVPDEDACRLAHPPARISAPEGRD